jgi:hypothetical protein
MVTGAGLQIDRSWLSPRPHAELSAKWEPLAATDVYEVTKSRFDGIEAVQLAKTDCVGLTADLAKIFAGSGYTCPEGKHPFLIRASYGQAGTGHYDVSRHGNDLLISHISLGHRYACSRSALVVNLDFTPAKIYVEVSVDE